MNARKNQPVADTTITTEQAGAIFKEAFKTESGKRLGTSTSQTMHEFGPVPIPTASLPVRPVARRRT